MTTTSPTPIATPPQQACTRRPRCRRQVSRWSTPVLLLGLLLLGLPAFASPTTANLDNCRPLSLADDAPLAPAERNGRWLYLDFWASWCVPCRQTFPFMNTLQADFAAQGLDIMAISLDDGAEEARRFLAEYPADFAVALDTRGRCPRDLEVPGLPAAYLISPDGSIQLRHLGFKAEDAAEIRRTIEQALSGQL